jgi:hypothetical protein
MSTKATSDATALYTRILQQLSEPTPSSTTSGGRILVGRKPLSIAEATCILKARPSKPSDMRSWRTRVFAVWHRLTKSRC